MTYPSPIKYVSGSTGGDYASRGHWAMPENLPAVPAERGVVNGMQWMELLTSHSYSTVPRTVTWFRVSGAPKLGEPGACGDSLGLPHRGAGAPVTLAILWPSYCPTLLSPQNPDIVLVHYLNVPAIEDCGKPCGPILCSINTDKKEWAKWTKEELIGQLKPMCE